MPIFLHLKSTIFEEKVHKFSHTYGYHICKQWLLHQEIIAPLMIHAVEPSCWTVNAMPQVELLYYPIIIIIIIIVIIIIQKVLMYKYKTFIMGNDITCTKHWNYRIGTTLCTLETWFFFRCVTNDNNSYNNNNNNNLIIS